VGVGRARDSADEGFCEGGLVGLGGMGASRKPAGTAGCQFVDCAYGSVCNPASFTCEAKLSKGEACVVDIQCDSNRCAGGS